MTNRTVQINGSVTKNGNPATGQITAILNGATVFSGTVPSATNPGILFTFEVAMDLAGSIPMTLNIQNCDVYQGGILANYTNIGTEPGVQVSSGPDGYYSTDPTQDSRANVTCTGAAYCSPPPPVPRPEGAEGTWGWQVDTNGDNVAIFSYDLQIVPGYE